MKSIRQRTYQIMVEEPEAKFPIIYLDDESIQDGEEVNSLEELDGIECYGMASKGLSRIFKDPKDADYAMENLETESPELYPEEMTKKCLVLFLLKNDGSAERQVILYDIREGEFGILAESSVLPVDPEEMDLPNLFGF